MREIKFRAWDTFNTVYYYSKDYKNLAEFFAMCQKCIDGGNELIFQDSTGLSDKNGKEIYEGDIVRNNWNQVFDEIRDMRSVEWLLSDGFLAGQENNDKLIDAEIIGNIYENPELLGKG